LQTNGKDNLERERVAMSVFSGTDQNLRFMNSCEPRAF
jgi:hypothetical protein